MKKQLLIILLVAGGASQAFAQTAAGNLFFGGSVGFQSEKEENPGDDDKTTTFSFTPSAGYFVADNFAVGLNLGVSATKNDDGEGEDKYTAFSVGPFARYYMFTSNEKFAFIGEAALGFGFGKYDPEFGGETKTSSFNVRISPGFAYFFNEHWALDLTLQGISYNSFDPDKDSDAENDKSSSFVFGVSSFNPTLGFRYFLK